MLSFGDARFLCSLVHKAEPANRALRVRAGTRHVGHFDAVRTVDRALERRGLPDLYPVDGGGPGRYQLAGRSWSGSRVRPPSALTHGHYDWRVLKPSPSAVRRQLDGCEGRDLALPICVRDDGTQGGRVGKTADVLIVMSGTSSSGKTTLARGLQLASVKPLFHLEADRFLPVLDPGDPAWADEAFRDEVAVALHRAIRHSHALVLTLSSMVHSRPSVPAGTSVSRCYGKCSLAGLLR